MRRAANGITILQAQRIAWHLFVFQIAANPVGDLALTGMRFYIEQFFAEVERVTFERQRCKRCDAACQSCKIFGT